MISPLLSINSKNGCSHDREQATLFGYENDLPLLLSNESRVICSIYSNRAKFSSR